MQSAQYYLMPDFKYLDLNEEYAKLISFLKTVKTIKIEEAGKVIEIQLVDTGVEGTLEAITSGDTDNNSRGYIRFSFEPTEINLPSLMRGIATPLRYRVFSPSLNSYLPDDHLLIDGAWVIDPKIQTILNERGYRPLFFVKNTLLLFAQPNGQEEVHLINNVLLDYLLTFGNKPGDPNEEFSYEVAPDLQTFAMYYDCELIPFNFYLYYKKPLKILNFTTFDTESIDRKVFVKPLVTELNKRDQKPYIVAAEGSSLIIMDKIRPGENLETTLKRVLREELKIADDFVRAKITKIEFDRDKEGIITPRLVVVVYVDKIKEEAKERIENEKGRGWQSIN